MNNRQKSELVVKDNALINASYNLDLVEQRLILLAILEIRRIGSPEYWMPFDSIITVKADEYAKAFGTTRQASYIALKEASKTLFNRQFSYKEKDKEGTIYAVTARWVTKIYYADDEAIIKLNFSDEFIPLVTELEKRFTSYELSKISQITSGYGLRLYEILMSWKSQGKTPVFEINEFRSKLGVFDDTYKRMGQFKERVLDKAVSQINEFTDIHTTYEQHKQGRNIIGFSFTIKQKAKAIKNKDSDTIDIFDNLTDKEREIIAQKNAYADQIGATAEHRENLIRQGLTTHRQAEQDEKERKQREKAERQVQEQQDKERLALAQRQFEQILASDELINAYLASNNLNERTLRRIQKVYWEQGDFRAVFKCERHKFEQVYYLKQLNLDFLD